MTENVTNQLPKAGPEHQRLEVFIGKWINEGHTIATADAPAVPILTSDVYEWMPGGFFVLPMPMVASETPMWVGRRSLATMQPVRNTVRTSLTVRAASVLMS